MRRSRGLWLIALGLLAGILVLLGGRDFGASSSTLSRDAGGWLAARRYLETRDTTVTLRDRAFVDDGTAIDEGVLVLAFPWQHGIAEGELQALGEHLRAEAGNTVVLAYSGEPMELRETRVLEALTLETEEIRPRPPLHPGRWWSYHRESWLLEPTEGGSPVRVAAFRRAPIAPGAARVLYRDADERPLIFTYPLHRGRVVVLPASALANGWIESDGNADFLESLRLWLGPTWTFDEYHHGLLASDAETASATRFAWDLFIAHLALIYLLGLIRLGRPFGPTWQERPAAAGSTASFLRQLGALHHKLGHHAQASELMVERARALEPELPGSEDLLSAGDANAKKQLMETARRVSRAQRRKSL